MSVAEDLEMTPEQTTGFGFVSSLPGHKVEGTKTPGYSQGTFRFAFTCTCGMWSDNYCHQNQNGKIGARTLDSWWEHINAAKESIDAAYEIGTVAKKRVTWRVFVSTYHYRHVDQYIKPHSRYDGWTTGVRNGSQVWYSTYPWGIFLDKGKSGKTLYRVYQNKDKAVEAAILLLRKSESRGDTVTRVLDDPNYNLEVVTPLDAITQLLEEADEARGIGEINGVLEHINEFLGMMRVVAAKRDELVTRQSSLLTS